MKILLWAPFGAGTHYWGPGTSAYRLFKNNVDAKITLVHASAYQSQFPNTYYEQVKIGSIDNKSMIGYFLYIVSSYKWIRRNHQSYDVFYGITAYFFTFLPALFFRKFKNNAKIFIKISGINGGFNNNGFISKLSGFRYFRNKYANKLSGYISISSDITKSLLENKILPDKIFYIPNGVDVTRFHPIGQIEKEKLRKENNVKNIFTLVYVGGLTFNKNVIETVKAVKDLLNKGYKVQFLIVGPDRSGGIIEKELIEFITQNKISDSCIRIEHSLKPEIYFQMSDVFVLNSKFEGLSNSLLEAMSTGLPPIAYPASGTIDLIENNINGFLAMDYPVILVVWY